MTFGRTCTEFIAILKAGGELVLSGILAEQAESIRDAYSPYLQDLKIVQQGDWIRVTGKLIKAH